MIDFGKQFSSTKFGPLLQRPTRKNIVDNFFLKHQPCIDIAFNKKILRLSRLPYTNNLLFFELSDFLRSSAKPIGIIYFSPLMCLFYIKT